jgi:hypothetical protein
MMNQATGRIGIYYVKCRCKSKDRVIGVFISCLDIFNIKRTRKRGKQLKYAGKPHLKIERSERV